MLRFESLTARVLLLACIGGLVAVVGATPAQAATCSKVRTLSLSRSTVEATGTVAGRVVLNCAVRRDVTVRLTGGDGVALPATVVVPRGRSLTRFNVTTAPRPRSGAVRIQARSIGAGRSALLRIHSGCASRLESLAVPPLIHAGETASATVRLACAPGSPVRVNLAADHPMVHVTTVTVPAGSRAARFPVRVDASRLPFDRPRATTISATYVGRARTESAQLDIGIATLTFTSFGASSPRLNLQLTESPGERGPIAVALGSDNQNLHLQREKSFSGSVRGSDLDVAMDPVSSDTVVTVAARLGTQVVTARSLVLRPYRPGDPLKLVTSEPGPLTFGGQVVTASFGSMRPPGTDDVDARISLIYPDGSAVENPANPTRISATGGVSTLFSIELPRVTRTTTLRVRAVGAGFDLRTPITVHPTASVAVPAQVEAGVPFTVTITADGPSSIDQRFHPVNGLFSVPEEVTLAKGRTSVTFEATADATLSGTYYLEVLREPELLSSNLFEIANGSSAEAP
ncbi:hypothetical protein [Nocardioides sp.]|uniref:hypothetical protein n=1 Tax=Nocardioides sp. TaxID=35761 RepID=UPI00351422D0